jgi:hypothetical protein
MAETVESVAAPPPEDQTEESVTELLEQLGRELTALVFHEGRLTISRHTPEFRRARREVVTALSALLAFLTAFALANAAAVRLLSMVMADWVAPLVLAAAWTAVGVLLALSLRAQRRSRASTAKDAEQGRAEAEQAVQATLEQLKPAISREIALAAVPVASDMASGVVDAGDEIVESADDFVESITEDVPGGGVVNQVWDFVLMPGRLGIRVATTVLKRDEPSS